MGIYTLCFGSLFSLWGGVRLPADALTTANVNNAYKAGNGAELWDTSTKSFNQTVLADIVNTIFKNNDPVSFIKENGNDDYNNYGKISPFVEASKEYWVVPATVINEQAGNANNGMVVKLGGKDWMAASLTLDNDKNVVLTLMLSDDIGKIPYTSSSPSKANLVYSCSNVRNYLLTDNSLTLFNDTSTDGFAYNYLVQPKNIQYQHTENSAKRRSGWDFMGNEALGVSTYGTTSGYLYQPGETYNGVLYEAWGDDYIWTPSFSEVGLNDNGASACIWKLSNNQRCCNGTMAYYIWYRSVYSTSSICMSTASGILDSGSTGSYSVRPAIHLNLTAAGLGTVLENPENVTTMYNGDVQTLKDAYTAKPTEMDWYDAEWYEHTGNYVAITPETELKNAGTYWVKAEIKQNWIDAVNAEVEADGSKYGWSEAQKNAAKEARSPKFKGDPVTEEGHTETDTVRWFKFVINPKELTVNKPSYNSTTREFTAPKFADESEFNGMSGVPTLATHFTGAATDGEKYDEIDIVPDRRGTYTAQAIFVKSPTDKTEYTEGNFAIKNASTINCELKVNRKRLPTLSVAEASKTYTGKEIKFLLNGYTEEWRQNGLLVIPSDMRIEGNDTDGWYLIAEDSGTYTVSAAIKSDSKNDWCWQSDNVTEESTEDKAITITITRKTLFVDFISSTGAFLLQKGAEVSFSIQPSNAVEGDDVKISLEYYKPTDNTTAIAVPSGILDASALEEAGTYQLSAVLNDATAADNKNYVLDASMASQNFTVSARQINIESVSWQYTQNNGVPTVIADSAGGSAASPAIVVYNGSTFVFSLANSANDLHTAGVKVDTTFGVNGYKNGLQTNATDNAVAITVKLIPYNEEYAFNDSNGKPLDEQSVEFTLYVKVDKATIDFSKLVWSADEVEYTGLNIDMSVVSGLPSFLTATYSGARAWKIGEYTARISGLFVSDANAAKNYNVPATTDGIPSHNWKIIKKKIHINWVLSEETGTNGNIIFLPTVSDNSDEVLEYSYYNADKTIEMTLNELFDDIDPTEYKTYYSCVRLKPKADPDDEEDRTFSDANCVLILGDEEVIESYREFEAGGGKNPVRVGLKKSTVVYNKDFQPAEVEMQGVGLTLDDLTVTYKLKNAAGDYADFSGTPMNAGEYKVKVAISAEQSGDFAITGECEFDYIIEKASYDVSAMKWVDTRNGNAEYTEPYVYAPNLTHVLSFVGDDIDGLTVNYTSDTEANLEGSNAKDYNVVVTFEVRDPDNYNIPEDIEFTWQILPYTPDLSGVRWNYNDKPFVFSIVGGVAVKYKAELLGLPEGMGLEDLIVYDGDTGEYSDAGSHVTTFSIDETSEKRANYGELNFGLLNPRLVWEIAPLKVEKAAAQQTVTYRPEGYDFSEITNMPEDFAQYFDIRVLTSIDEDLPQTDTSWVFINADWYRIQIKFKQGMNRSNGGTTDNVKWSDNSRGAYQIVLTVDKLVFDLNGWTPITGNDKPEAEVEDIAELEKYFDYVLFEIGKENEPLDYKTVTLEYDTNYSLSLKLKPEYAGNVAIRYKEQTGEQTAPYVFKTDIDPFKLPPNKFYDKPTGNDLRIELRFTNKTQTFTLGSWFVSDVMEVLSGALEGKDAGEYEVVVGFKRGSRAAWKPESPIDSAPVTIVYAIIDNGSVDRFILTDEAAASHPYKFQYGDFSELQGDISDYVYTAETALYITRLALNDTIEKPLAQFANGESIKVYDAKGVEITDYTKVLMTGIMLRLVDGENVLNQLTISVLGDVNGDGKINTIDKAQQNSLTLGTKELGAAEKLACDINADGKVNTIDKARLNSQSLGTTDIYDGLRLPAAASAVQTVSETYEEVEELAIEPIAEETAVIAAEECEPIPETEREEPAREPISAVVVIADTRRLRIVF